MRSDPTALRWVSAREQWRRRWLLTLIPAGAVATLASARRHDSTGLLVATAMAAAGALLAVIQVSALTRRYGGLRSSTHLGEAVTFAVARPRFATAIAPVMIAAIVAAMFLITADSGDRRDRTAFTLILFAGVCALWIGFDTIAVILTARWERATGLRLFCHDTGWFHRGPPTHIAVEVAPPARVRGRLPLVIASCALTLLVLVAVDLHTLIDHEAPWMRDLPTMARDTPASHVDPSLGAAASTLVGHQVEVRCWSAAAWAAILRVSGRTDVGFANPETSRIQLAPSVCAPLMALRYQHVEPPAASAEPLSFAVVVLGHEAGHLTLGSNEAEAECFGLRAAQRTAVLLGADPHYARLLQTIYRGQIYPRRDAIYRAGGCPETRR